MEIEGARKLFGLDTVKFTFICSRRRRQTVDVGRLRRARNRANETEDETPSREDNIVRRHRTRGY